jgi:predicted ATPase
VPEKGSELAAQLVGREAELTLLDEFLSSWDSPRAFVVTGESGIGKTALWESGVDTVRQRGLRVLSARGRVVPRHSSRSPR